MGDGWWRLSPRGAGKLQQCGLHRVVESNGAHRFLCAWESRAPDVAEVLRSPMPTYNLEVSPSVRPCMRPSVRPCVLACLFDSILSVLFALSLPTPFSCTSFLIDSIALQIAACCPLSLPPSGSTSPQLQAKCMSSAGAGGPVAQQRFYIAFALKSAQDFYCISADVGRKEWALERVEGGVSTCIMPLGTPPPRRSTRCRCRCGLGRLPRRQRGGSLHERLRGAQLQRGPAGRPPASWWAVGALGVLAHIPAGLQGLEGLRPAGVGVSGSRRATGGSDANGGSAAFRETASRRALAPPTAAGAALAAAAAAAAAPRRCKRFFDEDAALPRRCRVRRRRAADRAR